MDYSFKDSVQFLLRLLDTPSPTGFCEQALQVIEEELAKLGISSSRSKKGSLGWEIAGSSSRHVTFSAHVDTLGAMVKEIKPSGRLLLHKLGGYDWATIEGADVKVHTQSGKQVTGTVVNTHQSIHVHGSDLSNLKRSQNVMEIRLDEAVRFDIDSRMLGIAVGDFVSIDAKPRLTPSGYIKSRHLDNKAAIAIFLYVSAELLKNKPQQSAYFHITTYEEVGHGAATGIPSHTDELIAVDMAAVGSGQSSDEHSVTLCLADSSGPYSHSLSNKLRAAASSADIELKTDIYPYYSSDGSAAWRAGGDYPVALIGPGIDASHAFERTHIDALEKTSQLMLAYLR